MSKKKTKYQPPPKVGWYYDENLLKELDKAAKEDNRSRNAEITHLLKMALEIRKRHKQETSLPLEFGL